MGLATEPALLKALVANFEYADLPFGVAFVLYGVLQWPLLLLVRTVCAYRCDEGLLL